MKSNFSVIYFFAIAMFLFSACGKDDNTNELSGTYKITSIKSENCTDPTENINFEFDENGCFLEQNIEVCIIGVWTFDNGDYTVSSNITIDGNSLGDAFSESGTYSIEGSKATLCPTNEDCEDATIRFEGDTFTVSGITDDDGCEVTMVATKN